MKSLILILAFMVLVPISNVYANAGVFTGYGHSIELTSTKDIQMVSEDVTIIPGRGRFLFDGGVPGMDRVEYDCTFVLKNLTDDKVTIKAGFPLNSQFLNPPYDKKPKTSDLVAKYNFIVQEEKSQYSVRYLPGDKDKKFKNLFLWEMSFAPHETKTLRVTYSMPISMALASTASNVESANYDKQWYDSLEGCMLEWFGYITETGRSWSGTIEKATFKVYIRGFEEYLKQRSMTEEMDAEEGQKDQKKFPVLSPTIFRITEPSKWKYSDNGFLELTLNDYEPDENILFHYYILSIPQTVDDANRLITILSHKGFSAEDYQDLIDIFNEFNGVKTDNKRIRVFLENQVWYGKEPLQKIPDKVLDTIKKGL